MGRTSKDILLTSQGGMLDSNCLQAHIHVDEEYGILSGTYNLVDMYYVAMHNLLGLLYATVLNPHRE